MHELEQQLRIKGLTDYYLEAVIGVNNVPSNRIASKLLSSEPTKTVDNLSGEPAMQYLKRIQTTNHPSPTAIR